MIRSTLAKDADPSVQDDARPGAMHMLRATLLSAVALAMAGCASSAHDMRSMGGTIDTGDITPGESKTLTFAGQGTVTIHCHPHPFMKQTVHVTGEPASATHVHIVDGNATDDYAFDAKDIAVGRGSLVTYHNHGALTHTATNEMGGM